MNNFTKSIVYSGVVLAAGLVAIFAIYNNISSDNEFAYIEPAAGTEAAEGITEGISNIGSSITEAAGSAAETVTETATQAAEATTEAAGNAYDATKEAASGRC